MTTTSRSTPQPLAGRRPASLQTLAFPRLPARTLDRALRTALRSLATGLLAAAPMASVQAQAPAARTVFAIPAGPLDGALTEFARRAGVLLSFDPAVADGRRSPGLAGAYSVPEGFAALLAGTGLQATLRADGGYALLAAPGAPNTPAARGAAASAATLPQVVVTGAAQRESPTGPLAGVVATRAASAFKTDTPIRETPQSVSVATADQIEVTKSQSLSDALEYTPGVVSQASTFNRMVDDVRVRGFNLANANTGMLRDGMKYQPSVYDGSQEPYGLERIEVLRGAASVLYGQLSPGGIINAVSKRPTLDPLRELTADIGNHDRRQVTGDFGGPLTEDGVWSYRVTGLLREANTSVDYINDDKRYIAPALTWRPSARTSLTMLASYQEMRTRFVAPARYDYTVNGRIPRSFFIGEPGYDRYDSDVFSAGYLFEHALNDQVKIRHNLRYFNSSAKFNYLSYGTLSAANIFSRGVVNRTEQSDGLAADTSMEINFRTGGLDHKLLAGFDYFRSTYDTHRYAGTASPLSLYNPVYGSLPALNKGIDNGTRTESDQLGIYLQDQMKLSDKWVFVLGGRQDWVDSTSTNYRTRLDTDAKDHAFTGRAGLVYLADNGLAPYASFGQSFVPQAGSDRLGNRFQPTESDQYELGIRYQPAGSSTLLSGSVYEIKQKNGLSADPVDTTFSVQTAGLRSRGVELEARTRLDRLELIANYAYTDVRTTASSVPADIGQRTNGVPFHTASVWGRYDLAGMGVPGMQAGLGARYLSESPITTSAGKATNIPGRLLFDAMLSYDLQRVDPRLRGALVRLNARNLLGREYVQCTVATGCRYGEPRSVIATVSYRW
ncbi:TonB-dependent siderophore receptor [Pigmentiphaga litoralis]|uniref:TonB-dependent siderophore receptor n=1 Tax=Pigmentiphaga litoralis TaxID=516702 RepID=UPI003B4318A4